MRVLKNQKGQMAIFIALFFQVLFVFFAMAINMGLVIHDKINLQNSVDLAAYYGAMKQAEVLNQMAHINYQMRQNYKLFTWRYRVLGTIGNRAHPMMFLNIPGQFDPDPSTDSWTRQNPPSSNSVEPTVCIAHPFWQEYRTMDPQASSLCRDNGQAIPAVPQLPSSPGFVLGAGNIAPIFQFLATSITEQCREAGFMNFAFASRILAHFRADGVARKNMMGTLARNLSRPEPLDLRNESIREGAEKTFRRNLTESNSSGVENFEYLNSMGIGACADPARWLPEVQINPVIFYTDWNASDSTGCNTGTPVPNRQGGGTRNPPVVINSVDNLPTLFQYNSAKLNSSRALIEHWAGEPNNEWHSSIGFEKNPWCMVYTGVQATTRVRKPFDPSGEGVVLQARGFAKPFGGRIGPWYGKTWPQGGATSQAASRNEMVDPNLPSREQAGSSFAGDPYQDVANYSRFPGDVAGMSSRNALSAMSSGFATQMAFAGERTPSQIALANYQNLNGLGVLQQTGDSLARDGQTGAGVNVPARVRNFELAAVAPDPFDAFYYSVEPRYHNNYFSGNTTNGGAAFQNAQENIYDFGSTKDGWSGAIHSAASASFSVIDQVSNVSNNTYESGYTSIIRDWTNLLTSWHQKEIVDYSLDPEKFGRCVVTVDQHNPQFPTTGNCLQGGRTGYGVKSVSRDFLLSSEHALGGGSSGATGAILNPPTF